MVRDISSGSVRLSLASPVTSLVHSCSTILAYGSVSLDKLATNKNTWFKKIGLLSQLIIQ